MRERVCKNCGGRSYKIVGQNMVKCMFCGTLYVDEQSSKEEEVLIVHANELARECKFKDAIAEYDKILTLYPMSFEAYYRKALAKHKIVLYSNKKGSTQRPRFFGEIESIKDDEDFLKAMELVPPDAAKPYKDTLRRVERVVNNYKNLNAAFDVFVLRVKEENENQKFDEMIEVLKKQNLNVFLYDKQKEEDVFNALKTSKVFLFVVNSNKGFNNGDIKHIYDRYLYFISEKQKTKQSFVLILDGVDEKNLPTELFLKKTFDMSSISFLEDIVHKVVNEMQVSVVETAKIEKVEIKQVEPQKIDYIDIQNIEPTELGTYHVENIQLSDANKIKWIFLTLKHGDFASAQDFISAELQKDPNNAQLLFAQLMVDQNAKTEEEFFANISNFHNKEIIDKILAYASKDFAESFVNRWINLLTSLDGEDYYNTYLLYLAKFDTYEREKLITCAEHKAIETMDDTLIKKVEKCLDKNDVKRYVNFYFTLAQKSDNQEFYDKVLSLDQGHEQSNLMILLQRFKTIEDKLNYHNREEVEEVLKYLSEDARTHYVSSIVEMILPIAFHDLERACQQLDFYLSYVAENEKLVELLKKVALEFQSMGFFKEAEKYLSIAVSKSSQAELYWELIKVKSHCKTEQELILTNVKVTKFAEWETLLSLSDEKQAEYYAAIISKINLYKGERQSFKADLLDKINLSLMLEEFLVRNQKILLEFEKQGYTGGVYYFKVQLEPFEKYLKSIADIKTFEEYNEFVEKIRLRLAALNLTLDMSVSVLHIQSREVEAKNVFKGHVNQKIETEKAVKDIKKDRFLKKFCFVFLELCPLLFMAGIFVFLIVSPKETYLHFNQTFFVVSLMISIALALGNLLAYMSQKKRTTFKNVLPFVSIVVLGFLNLILFCVGFYFSASAIEINNSKEMKKLLNNAPHASFCLTQDIDMADQNWTSVKFSGTFDGKGFTVKNIKNSLFATNSGEIKNLKIEIKNKTYNTDKFAAIAFANSGTIENCQVYGEFVINCDSDVVVGGIVGKNSGGYIENCFAKLTINIVSDKDLQFGGLAAIVEGDSLIQKNVSEINLVYASTNGDGEIGGLIGTLNRSQESIFDQNQTKIDFNINNEQGNLFVGGLVGSGYQESKNNFATGKIVTTGTNQNAFVGGLYGKYENSNLSKELKHSYSTILLDTQYIKGSLVGGLGGSINSCFATIDCDFVGQELFAQARISNCEKSYSSNLNFDPNVWNLSSEFPIFK